MKWRCLLAAVLSLAILSPAIALGPDEVLSDPALEARARSLSKELRCMVCQNQSIDDSDAPLARDLRILVRERLQAGESDQQVINFLVARYGEFVLLKPPLTWHTALLWLAPSGVLMLGTVTLIMARKRKTATLAPQALSDTEQRRLTALVAPPAAEH